MTGAASIVVLKNKPAPIRMPRHDIFDLLEKVYDLRRK